MFALLTLFLCSLSTSFSRTKYNPLGFAVATLGCGDILYGATATLECNSPEIFVRSFLQEMPAGAKDIFVQLEMKIENYCSLAAPYHFYTLTIEPTTGTTVKLMDVQWNADKDFTFFSQDGSSIKTAHKAVAEQNQPPNQWFSATSWVLLGSNRASGTFNYYGKATTTSGGAVSYPTTWTVDMNTKIYVCSDVNAATSIKCQVANFKIWYHVPITPIYAPIFKDGTTPNLIARYQLNQYTGYEVINSVSGTIGSGYFGSSTALGEDPVSANKPSWVPEEDPGNSKLMTDSGIEFTDTTQYVTLPVFPMMQSLFTPAYSLTVKLWFKPSATPSTISYIFQFASVTPAANIFSLQLNTNMKCFIKIYGLGISSDAYLSASSWNSIAMSLTSLDYINIGTASGYPYSYSLVINNVLDVKNQITQPTRYFHQTNNRVRLGGPPTAKGIISGVEIYSPGSNFITADTTCQPSTCLRDIGITSPSTCILPKCATNCAACFNSQENGCITCNTGYRLYQSKCVALTCKPGKFLNPGDTCQGCIAHCESCSNAVSCDVCETGFIKQGSICVCPPGSVLNSATSTCQNNNNPTVTCKYPFKIVASGTPEEQCVLDINEEDAEQAEQVAKISTVASYATNFGGALIALLSYNNVGLLLIGSLTEMLSYIQYLKIDYPPKVYQMLQEQDINSGGINIITEIPDEVAEAIPNRPLPDEFAKNDTHSSFVANCWELLVSLVSILVSIGLISFIVSCLNGSRNSRLHSFLSKLLLSLRWNLFLGIFCSSYGFTGIFTALEFRTVNMDSLLSILSFIVSLLINTLGFCFFFFIFHLSMIFRTIKTAVRDPAEQAKQLEETEEKWKSYGILMEDYKNDFLSQKIFLFIFMFRTYIHYSVLGYLNEYPFIQTCCFTIISICIITYLIRRRPMKGKMNYIQQMVCEMAILVVNITVVILASMDKWEIHDHNTRVKVGDVIIATNFGLSIAGSVFLVIETLSQIKEAYVFIKTWFRSQKTANLKIIKRNLDKSFNPPRGLETESKLKDLEISDLERSNNNVSVDQLKGPRNLIKDF